MIRCPNLFLRVLALQVVLELLIALGDQVHLYFAALASFRPSTLHPLGANLVGQARYLEFLLFLQPLELR